MKQTAEAVGSGERETLSLKQQITLQQFAALRAEAIATQVKVMRMRGELKMKQEEQARGGTEVTDEELDAFARSDPASVNLGDKAAIHRERAEQDQAALTATAAPTHVNVRLHETAAAVAEKSLAGRRQMLRDEVKRRKASVLKGAVAQLQSEIAIIAEQGKLLDKDVEEVKKQAEAFGGSSMDVEFLRAEIGATEGFLKTVTDEKEKLKVEIHSKPRIEVFQKAEAPTTPKGNKTTLFGVLGGSAGFLLPFLGILWWDVRSRRVNSPEDVSLAGLDVIGSVPLLPRGTLLHSAAASNRNRQWRNLMQESIDAVTARILYAAEQQQTRVVLVSSAIAGEGKTTVASQLALSLARTGHRTALVDFDLRRPAIDRVFNLSLSPGVAETLRSELDFREAVHQSDFENLMVLTAGRADHSTVKSLANGAVKGLFADLRAEYDFVIVDGNPILPTADVRMICRHVDGVVFSVLRDMSRIPSILDACEVLAGFGIRPIGAVVTGGASEFRYGYSYGYEATSLAGNGSDESERITG